MDAHRNVPGLNLDDCEEHKMNGRRRLRRSGGLVVLVAAAAVGLAACSSASSTPQVASLGKSGSTGGENSAATGSSAPTGDPTRLLNKWAACMRSHGDPNQADPTVDASDAIHVIVPAGYDGTVYGATGNSHTGAGVTCQAYLTAASTALRNGQALPGFTAATKAQWAECMQAERVPGFGSNPGSRPDPSDKTYQQAYKTCYAKTGVPGIAGQIPGEIELYVDGQLGEVLY